MSQVAPSFPDMREPPIVVLGASAGGLQAVESVLEGLSKDCPFAIVLAQHLSPNYKSHMSELLKRRTRLEVSVVQEGEQLEPGQVYILPPRTLARIDDGRIRFDSEDNDPIPYHPIDHLLFSLASSDHEKVAVILSGTGTDGSDGIREVHDAGGVTLVQNPKSAGFDGMPQNALATGLVDLKLPARGISEFLSNQRFGLAGPLPLKERVADWDGVIALIDFLSQVSGLDFWGYRQRSVMRRIERRLDLEKLGRPTELLEAVKRDARLRERMVSDLLISVTSFFRDAFSWNVLQKVVLPELIAKLRAGHQVRLWCPACSTGQEPFSLAIAIKEVAGDLDLSGVRIFASDASRENLNRAREGYYAKNEIEGLSEERLQRFFKPVGEGYTINPDLRAMIAFAEHNIMSDAPFTQLDLVSCRNMLIYMTREVQEDILSKFPLRPARGGPPFPRLERRTRRAQGQFPWYRAQDEPLPQAGSPRPPADEHPAHRGSPSTQPESSSRGRRPQARRTLRTRSRCGRLSRSLDRGRRPDSSLLRGPQ